MGINTEQVKRNILNELLNAHIKSRLDKSPTANPNANYDKIYTHLKNLMKNTSRIEAWSLTSMYTNGQIDQIQRSVVFSTKTAPDSDIYNIIKHDIAILDNILKNL